MGKGNAYHIDKLTILCAIFLYIKLKIKRLALTYVKNGMRKRSVS